MREDNNFIRAEINGQNIIITDNKINHDTVPEGLFVYDVEYIGDPPEALYITNKIEDNNYAGTIISHTPLIEVDERTKITDCDLYEDESVTIGQYKSEHHNVMYDEIDGGESELEINI